MCMIGVNTVRLYGIGMTAKERLIVYTYTLCFIFRVPLAKKSINVICRSVSKFAGCQIKGMTTGKIYTQGFFPRLLQTGIAWR